MKDYVEGFDSIFKNKTWHILIFVCAVVIVAYTGYQIYNAFAVKKVSIDSQHFNCTGTEPLGILAICNQYTMIKGVR